MFDWLIRRAKRTPYYHLTGYMNRWWLVPYTNAGSARDTGCGRVSWRRPLARLLQAFGVSIRVHEILRSDEGRDPHDHPWPYLTIILRGYYLERRYNDAGQCTSIEIHGPGAILWRPAGSWHRLELAYPVTTLFITGSKSQTWGFNVDGMKVPYSEYLKGRQ